MIIVKGYNYHNDYNQSAFTKNFDNIDQFIEHIQKVALKKIHIRLPASNEDGSFDQRFANTMCGCLQYSTEYCSDGAINSMCIDLITENNKILFSSGALTDSKGHISMKAKTAFANLRQWKESEYEFAE